MAKRFTREEIKQRFQASIDAGQPIVIASAASALPQSLQSAAVRT